MGGKHKNLTYRLHSVFKQRELKNWQLLLLFFALSFLTATLLRLDHIRMTELRSAVLSADESGNDEEVASALRALQDFTFSHIVINITEANGHQYIEFGTGPFYLEHQYIRHASAALEAAEQNFVDTGNPNGNIYAKAAAVCKPQAIAHGWSWNSSQHINCMLGEIAKYPASEVGPTTAVAELPSTELYRLNYHSPVFAPTLTGFMLLLCAILLAIIILRALAWLVIEITLFFIKKF